MRNDHPLRATPSVPAVCLLIAGCLAHAQPVPARPGIPPDTFPIVAFSAGNPNDSNFAEVKRVGFDTVHRYRLASRAPADVKAYLDMADKHGLKVMMDVSAFVDPRHSPAKDMAPDERLEALRTAIRTWKSHPALGFWYVYDEPAPKVMSPASLKQIHDTVKAETPDIPTAIAQHWGEKWWEYMPCVDIVMPDFYPIRDQAFPEVSRLPQMAEFFGKVGRVSKRTVPIVQCFGFPRLPNSTEVRYMLFSSLTQGIEGMAFWSYWYARFKPFQIRNKDGGSKAGEFDPAYMRTVYSPVLLELKAFVASIMPADKVAYAKGAKDWEISDTGLLHGLWRRDGATYVVAVNNQAEERDINAPFDCGLGNCVLEPLGATRRTDARIRDARLVISATTPWEVFVWRCTPVPK